MIRLYRILLLLLLSFGSYAQNKTAFKQLRYDEDFSFLKKDTSYNWYKQTKYLPLYSSSTNFVSFGGDIRYQYFNVKNEGWGEEPQDKDGYLFTRLLVHGDLHAGKHFRAFVQLQSSLANGKLETSPVDENPLDLHQAFIDVKGLTGKTNWVFRLGRQELSYGSQRIVALREGPNNRQSFDGFKTILQHGSNSFDLFYTHHVAAKKGLFDDGFNKKVKLWGAYFVRNKIPVLSNADLYYLGLYKTKALFDDGEGKEIRHSLGSRIWGGNRTWKYDIEGLYQFGTLAQKTIKAWTASINTSYSFERTKLHPQLGLKTEFISGDARSNDDQLGTFNALFPRGGYFGLASLIGPANLVDVHPYTSLQLTNKIDWNIDYDVFWRYSLNDGIYAPNMALIYSGKNISGKSIGQQLSTDLVYTPNDFLYFRTEFTWFNTGEYLKNAGPGKDILFFCVTLQFKF